MKGALKMTEDTCEKEYHHHDKKRSKNYGGSGIIGCTYFMALIGAAVYYIQPTTTAGAGFIGFLKALVWPGFLIFDLLKYLHM